MHSDLACVGHPELTVQQYREFLEGCYLKLSVSISIQKETRMMSRFTFHFKGGSTYTTNYLGFFWQLTALIRSSIYVIDKYVLLTGLKLSLHVFLDAAIVTLIHCCLF